VGVAPRRLVRPAQGLPQPENWFELGDGLQIEFKASQASGSADFVLQLQDATAGAADGPTPSTTPSGSSPHRARHCGCCKAGGTDCDQYFTPNFD
jgi:hypothetical protein